jgi:hypothetical protein
VAHAVLAKHGIDASAMVLLEDRAEVDSLLGMDDLVELVIARGSSQFIRHVRSHTRIPVMAHADGICHAYLHASADPAMAAKVLVDSKCSYPAACNAVETLLWDVDAGAALDACVKALEESKVELRGCAETRKRHPQMKPASEEDWATEYGDLVLSIRQVSGIDEALAHIARYGSRHTDTILTQDAEAAARFLSEVDSACVFHNASTRFSDGYRFGLGAEVGISTDKLHARGPVGVEGLLTYRWLLFGRGQCTLDYSSRWQALYPQRFAGRLDFVRRRCGRASAISLLASVLDRRAPRPAAARLRAGRASGGGYRQWSARTGEATSATAFLTARTMSFESPGSSARCAPVAVLRMASRTVSSIIESRKKTATLPSGLLNL